MLGNACRKQHAPMSHNDLLSCRAQHMTQHVCAYIPLACLADPQNMLPPMHCLLYRVLCWCAAYVSHGTFSWRVLAKETEERRVAQAKLMRQAGADPDLEQQQGKSRAHRISQSVLQQIANLKQQKQQKQEPAAQTSNSAGTETGSSDSAGAKQQGQQQQEQQEGGKVDVQSTEKASDAESKSVSVAAVDDMDYLLPTSPDETGKHMWPLFWWGVLQPPAMWVVT
mgnify:CR=1 FL=1